MNKLTQAIVEHAHAIAQEIGAEAVMFAADVLESAEELEEVVRGLNYRVVLVGRNSNVHDFPKLDSVTVITVPDIPLSRLGQIKIAMVIAVAEKIFSRGDLVICLSGVQESDSLDMLTAIRIGEEVEFFVTDESNPLPPDVQPAVFERILSIASELATEGREHRPVGAIFVLGDHDHVLEESRQLIRNPFHGYTEEERNVLSDDLEETLKEYAAIDGAFIIRGDGVLLSAGRYLMPKGKPAEQLRAGLGTRHEAAAAITAVTDAVAICLSQSTSTITIFNSGRVMTEIEKIRGGSDRWTRVHRPPENS